MDRHDEDTYIIPHNYTDNGKIFGIIEKQSVYVAMAWFVPMTLINFKCPLFPIDMRIFLEIITVIPPTLLILAGIGGDTVLDFVIKLAEFKDRSKIYKRSDNQDDE